MNREAIKAMRARRQAATSEWSLLVAGGSDADVVSGECPTAGCGSELFAIHQTPRGLLFAARIRPLPTDRGGMPWERDAAMARLDDDTLDRATDAQLAAHIDNPARDTFGSTKWAPDRKDGYLVLDLIEEPSEHSGADLPGLWTRCDRKHRPGGTCRVARRLSPQALVPWSQGRAVDPVEEVRPSTT